MTDSQTLTPTLSPRPLTPQRNYDRKRTRAAIATATIPKAKVVWMSSVDVWPDWGYPGTYTQYVIFGSKYKKTYVEVRRRPDGMR